MSLFPSVLPDHFEVSCHEAGNPDGLNSPDLVAGMLAPGMEDFDRSKCRPWVLRVKASVPFPSNHSRWFMVPVPRREKWTLSLWYADTAELEKIKNPELRRLVLLAVKELTDDYGMALLAYHRSVGLRVTRAREEGVIQ